MKVSAKVEFGIAAIIDIALYSELGEAVTVYSIAKRQNISSKYLEQIITVLRQANLIRGLKGSKGGYVIARPTDKITFKEIINALDVTILNDMTYYGEEKDSEMIKTINDNLWNKMTGYLQDFAQNITLAEMTDIYRNSKENQAQEFMYYI
ncbi:MAG: Rrf2 family transcriptional regulator [Firmicutes bacterium]|nr:Rrf2 family transcriptional regulator [Bacillota bacterium]